MGTQILTVEDDERIRTAVRLALEDEGWEVVEARSGEEALDLFKRHDADVVLRPDLTEFGLLAWDRMDDIIDAGYRYAIKELPEHQEVIQRVL